MMKIPSNHTISSFQQLSQRYLLALCRIYLSDFICGDYQLPATCSFLLNEVTAIVEELRTNDRQT
jgi:hypothetical protein